MNGNAIKSRVAQAINSRGPGAFALGLYDDNTPIQREIKSLCNAHEEARRVGDETSCGSIKIKINEKVDQLIASNGDGHSNGRWVISMVQSVRARIFGNYSEAIENAKNAYAAAVTDRQKGLARHAEAGSLIRIGRYEDAVDRELDACSFDPNNPGFHAHLVEALIGIGDFTSAAQLMQAVPSPQIDLAQAEVWRVVLKFDEFFVVLRDGVVSQDTKGVAQIACQHLCDRLGV